MNWAWATSLDHVWRSPSFPMWLTLSAAAFFGVIVFFMLLRTEQSVAGGALAIITLLSLGIAVASMLRGYEPATRVTATESRSAPATPTLPALSCVDDLAGDTVGQACEKAVFASPESTAAAVNYAASMLTRLIALGDAASAQRSMSSEMQVMRRAIERDRYGLMAHVLMTRERCTPTQCAAYRSLTDNHQLITNMDEHAFDNLVARYAPAWNTPQVTSAPAPLAMMPPSVPTGRPTNAEFPSAANTPPVSIMTPEPGTGAKPAAGTATAPARPAQAAAAPAVPAPAPPPAARRQAKRVPAPPTQISPAAQAPAASDD